MPLHPDLFDESTIDKKLILIRSISIIEACQASNIKGSIERKGLACIQSCRTEPLILIAGCSDSGGIRQRHSWGEIIKHKINSTGTG